jgi:hypothetical protein
MTSAALAVFLCSFASRSAYAQPKNALGFDPYVTFAANSDVGYHQTQFFEPNHNTAVGQWDARAEVWLPPFRKKFSWGPYLRTAGIAASEPEAWENAWLAGPGVGFQVYPFSAAAFRKADSTAGRILGPLRAFGEYNRLNYWGREDSWRPHKQIRLGLDYWGARHVNDAAAWLWHEIWGGAWWQSANEFAPDYDTVILATAVRVGVRDPGSPLLGALTPYVAVESSLTSNEAYYWENRLLAGGGIRFAPALSGAGAEGKWLNRLAIYGEYLYVATYYRHPATPTTPSHDVRIGVSVSIGEWYR